MSTRAPNGTWEETINGITQYTQNTFDMFDVALVVNRDKVNDCEPLSSDECEEVARILRDVLKIKYAREENVRMYVNGNLMGSRFERIGVGNSLSNQINWYRKNRKLTKLNWGGKKIYASRSKIRTLMGII